MLMQCASLVMHALVKESHPICQTYYSLSWWLSQILVYSSRIMVGNSSTCIHASALSVGGVLICRNQTTLKRMNTSSTTICLTYVNTCGRSCWRLTTMTSFASRSLTQTPCSTEIHILHADSKVPTSMAIMELSS